MIKGENVKTRTMHTLIGITVIAVILSVPAFATTVVKMELEQLVQRADFIVQGQVESVYSQWNAGRRLAFTYISIRVDDPLKGERKRSILIRQLGGSVGPIHMNVPGLPQFRNGEQVIVFLRRQDDSTFQVVGMNQGLYEIVEDFAVSNVMGLDLVDSKTGEMTRPVFVGRFPLDQFKARIKELVK